MKVGIIDGTYLKLNLSFSNVLFASIAARDLLGLGDLGPDGLFQNKRLASGTHAYW
jgi:hypothetical protein